jgi:cellulose synthase/poly-beta-1,6-N-acetylglucosamine synthase-like glycosyltransferase
VQLSENLGKAAAISIGVEHARCEIVAFADVRQRWAADALSRLLARFQDSNVGAVSGALILESPGANQGVGFYWSYEKWIRRHESEFDSTIGVTGAIAAVRRAIFHAIPPGTILDDLYWPMKVVMDGFRVVHESSALAFDRLPDDVANEFRRKVRTLAGNYQLLTRLPRILLPWNNRIWIQVISHKIFRLVVPWALLGALGAQVLLPGIFYAIVLWLQLAIYIGLTIGALYEPSKRPRLLSAGISCAMLNFAAWIAFWVWISGNASKSWSTIKYSVEKST